MKWLKFHIRGGLKIISQEDVISIDSHVDALEEAHVSICWRDRERNEVHRTDVLDSIDMIERQLKTDGQFVTTEHAKDVIEAWVRNNEVYGNIDADEMLYDLMNG